MKGLGTIINVVCILLGGLAGTMAGNRLKESVRESLMAITGISVVILGAGGAMSQMLTIVDGKLSSGGTIMMVVSLALGTVIGEMLGIEDKIVRFGEYLKEKSGSSGDQRFVSGFVTASCTVCIGAMAIIGSVQDGISGDYSVLAAKGVIDAILICTMAASQGKGCIYSAIPVGIFQGSFTLLAIFIGDLLSEAALSNLSLVGSVLILCVGLNLVRQKQIRVANALPAVVVAVIWGMI